MNTFKIKTLKIVVFTTKNGKTPFYTWLNKLNPVTEAIIRNRIDRIRLVILLKQNNIGLNVRI